MLSCLGVKYTQWYSNRYFNEHPNKNNMLGLSQMLGHYGVHTVGIQIDDANELLSVEPPFIAHVGADFVTVKRLND